MSGVVIAEEIRNVRYWQELETREESRKNFRKRLTLFCVMIVCFLVLLVIGCIILISRKPGATGFCITCVQEGCCYNINFGCDCRQPDCYSCSTYRTETNAGAVLVAIPAFGFLVSLGLYLRYYFYVPLKGEFREKEMVVSKTKTVLTHQQSPFF